jgi:hypothetical protein
MAGRASSTPARRRIRTSWRSMRGGSGRW